MSTADTLLWLCRWLTDGAALWLWGGSLFVLALLPAALRQGFWQQQAGWNRCAGRVLLLATLSALPLHSAILADGWADSWQATTLLSVVRDTSMGRAWCWQLLAALALWLATRRSTNRHALLATACASAALLASLTLSGHAAMLRGWPGLLHRGNDWLHLLGAGAWLGALPLVLQLLRQPPAALHAVLPAILRRFSSAGHAVVLLVILSGLYNFYLINDSLLKVAMANVPPLEALFLRAVIAVLMGLPVLGWRQLSLWPWQPERSGWPLPVW